jgi:uncharacterized protein (TIGR02145 family)
MKKILLLLFSAYFAAGLLAQVPQSFKYQTVVRETDGTVIGDQDVSFRISVLQYADDGDAIYVETFDCHTNDYGLATFNIGEGTTTDDFTDIDWNDGPYFVLVEIDPAGGTVYEEVGTSQLLSVPYALQSVRVQQLSDATPVLGDILFFDGTKWVNVPAGEPGQFLQMQPGNIPAWGGPTYPTLSTSAVSEIKPASAISGGNITDDGGGAIQERGVCWSTSENPTLADSKTSDGSGTGSFVSKLTGLLPNTTYYVRAYATNWNTAYGNQVNFTTTEGVSDYDGNGYEFVTIGTQVWMKENLKTTHFDDGSLIPNVTSDASWQSLASGAYCWYNNDILNKNLYGALYNYYAVSNAHNLCPDGWHVPTNDDWNTLITFLGGASVAGGKMKETGTDHWSDPNTDATNESGFTALPGGHRQTEGAFATKGEYCYWWYSDVSSYLLSSYNSGGLLSGGVANQFGFSVRCIQDSGKK